MSLLLEGKRSFITGGTRGIGAALCQVFAREGADVAFSYNSRDDLAEEMMRVIQAIGRRVRSFKVSVTDRFGMKHLTRELVQDWGGLDILVNNAAINRGDNFATTTDRAWDEVIHTNVDSLFAVTKPIYKQMIRQRKGSILNITSIGAIRALPTAVHYANSKAAMIADRYNCLCGECSDTLGKCTCSRDKGSNETAGSPRCQSTPGTSGRARGSSSNQADSRTRS